MSHDLPSRRPAKPFESSAESEPLSADALRDAFLFEIAWEVCNQVGGIYQVIRSKAPLMAEQYGERYCLIGPYVEARARLEVETAAPPGWLARVVKALSQRGLVVHFGRWLIPSRPFVLLIESHRLTAGLNEAKYLLWEHHGVESPAEDAVIDQAVMFGEAVRLVLEVASAEAHHGSGRGEPVPQKLVAHFHEWQGGVALPRIRRAGLPIATVFTTHATQLGRYMASNESDFYEKLPRVDHAAEAAKYNLRTQHGIERACAHGAHVFTTVSQITAEECTSLLGRTPEVITPNGLGIQRYNVGHDFQTFHADFKDRLHTFSMGYFFPSYHFDLERTLYMFTSGRFEPRNKGFDLCLEAMARLNAELKTAGLGVTVVFFIITARPTRSLHPHALEKRGVLNELRGVCSNIVQRVGDRLFKDAALGSPPHLDDMVEEYWHLRYKRTQAAFRTQALPPVVTHVLDSDDPVIDQIRRMQLFNRPEDPVKVVYHPEFISPVNPLWGIEYEQFVRGCHLGLFPSAYEPWGYTPLECMALGTPSVTSDLAGFGRYVVDTVGDLEQSGLSVLSRRGRSYEDAAVDLKNYLLNYCRTTRRERVTLRNEVEKRSWDFDWSRLGPAYYRAHELALSRTVVRRTRLAPKLV
jgi:glycogen(starch) synthase